MGDPAPASGIERRPEETLRASAVSRSFEGVQALQDVTLELHRREVVGLVGPNGAGKSTLVNVFTENVEVAALGVGVRTREARRRAGELLELLGLTDLADARAGALAQGDERRLGVARALVTEPAFVLMDEPAAGLPEAEVPEFAEVVRSVRDDHRAGVLLIDHNMALVMGVCDRIHVLDQGRTLAAGTPTEIRGDLNVAAAYLGETAVETDA